MLILRENKIFKLKNQVLNLKNSNKDKDNKIKEI